MIFGWGCYNSQQLPSDYLCVRLKALRRAGDKSVQCINKASLTDLPLRSSNNLADSRFKLVRSCNIRTARSRSFLFVRNFYKRFGSSPNSRRRSARRSALRRSCSARCCSCSARCRSCSTLCCSCSALCCAASSGSKIRFPA